MARFSTALIALTLGHTVTHGFISPGLHFGARGVNVPIGIPSDPSFIYRVSRLHVAEELSAAVEEDAKEVPAVLPPLEERPVPPPPEDLEGWHDNGDNRQLDDQCATRGARDLACGAGQWSVVIATNDLRSHCEACTFELFR